MHRTGPVNVTALPELEVTFSGGVFGPDQPIRLTGSGFDTSLRAYVNGKFIPIEALSSKELVISSPWPTGVYDLTLERPDTTIELGRFEVTRSASQSQPLEERQYMAYWYELKYATDDYTWLRNSDGSWAQEQESGQGSKVESGGFLATTDTAFRGVSYMILDSTRTRAKYFEATTDYTWQSIGGPGEGSVTLRDSSRISVWDLEITFDGNYYHASASGNLCGEKSGFYRDITHGTESSGTRSTNNRSSFRMEFK